MPFIPAGKYLTWLPLSAVRHQGQTAIRCSLNRPPHYALRSRSNLHTPCVNVLWDSIIADCTHLLTVVSSCIACRVAMCSDCSCLVSSRADSMYPDANVCWISLTSLSLSFLLRSVWSLCCIHVQNASCHSRNRNSSMRFMPLFPFKHYPYRCIYVGVNQHGQKTSIFIQLPDACNV